LGKVIDHYRRWNVDHEGKHMNFKLRNRYAIPIALLGTAACCALLMHAFPNFHNPTAFWIGGTAITLLLRQFAGVLVAFLFLALALAGIIWVIFAPRQSAHSALDRSNESTQLLSTIVKKPH
jgi:membrane protein implicated in regulation of membrane protease activity